MPSFSTRSTCHTPHSTSEYTNRATLKAIRFLIRSRSPGDQELDTTLQCHCDGKMGLHDEKLSKQPMKTVILCKYNTYLYIIYASESHLYIRIVWLYMMHRIYSYIHISYPYSICIYLHQNPSIRFIHVILNKDSRPQRICRPNANFLGWFKMLCKPRRRHWRSFACVDDHRLSEKSLQRSKVEILCTRMNSVELCLVSGTT